ncbi:MAG: hypothetical protein Q4D98_03435 [Planctomycetia bacterium]|nr:hypothetical protein [Planctomycetia bacterium]
MTKKTTTEKAPPIVRTMVTEKKASCPRCGSTDREKRNRSRTLDCSLYMDGIHYTKVTLSYTKCRKCGQVYIVRIYET